MDKDGNWMTTSVAFPGRTITARIWKVAVGRTDLYLLDTDYEANIDEDRQVTYHLYGGDWENRLKQELLLGVGGVRALRALGILRYITATRVTPRSSVWKDSANISRMTIWTSLRLSKS